MVTGTDGWGNPATGSVAAPGQARAGPSTHSCTSPQRNPRAAAERAAEERRKLEWLAALLPRHEIHLRRIQCAEAEARRKRRMLEWLATISDRHELELRRLQQALGLTLVYVTHDQVEAMGMADRIVLLHEGRIAQVGTPIELYERPASPVVARFIGQPPMNLIRLPGEDGLRGIRPEHIALGQGPHTAVLESAEYHGADRLLSLRLHDQLIKVRHAGREALPLGQTVSLGWPAERECRFPSEDA